MGFASHEILSTGSKVASITAKYFERQWFTIGTLGLAIFLSGTTLCWSVGMVLVLFPPLFGIYYEVLWFLSLVYTLLMGVGGILGAFVFFGYFRNFGYGLGKVFFVLTQVFTCGPPFTQILLYFHVFCDIPLNMQWIGIIGIIAIALLGLQIALWGIAFFEGRFFTFKSMASKAAGILFIIAGLLLIIYAISLFTGVVLVIYTFTILELYIGFILPLPAGILAIISIQSLMPK